MTSKERAYLIKLSSNLSPVFQLGKEGFTPEVTKALLEVLEARELIKINILRTHLKIQRKLQDLLLREHHQNLFRL